MLKRHDVVKLYLLDGYYQIGVVASLGSLKARIICQSEWDEDIYLVDQYFHLCEKIEDPDIISKLGEKLAIAGYIMEGKKEVLKKGDYIFFSHHTTDCLDTGIECGIVHSVHDEEAAIVYASLDNQLDLFLTYKPIILCKLLRDKNIINRLKNRLEAKGYAIEKG